jgi:hypothetical protein
MEILEHQTQPVASGDTPTMSVPSAFELVSHVICDRDPDVMAHWVINAKDRDKLAEALKITRATVACGTLEALQTRFNTAILEQTEIVKDELAALEKLAA